MIKQEIGKRFKNFKTLTEICNNVIKKILYPLLFAYKIKIERENRLNVSQFAVFQSILDFQDKL